MKRRDVVVAALCTAVAGTSLGLALRGNRHALAAESQDTPPQFFDDPDAPVLGPLSAPLPIVEFFDYRCPYCRRMHPLLQRLLQDDRGVRLIAKEWPVFGGPSITAARVALAANLQGKFPAVNDALFSATITDDASVFSAAEGAGADMTRLNHDLQAAAPRIGTALQRAATQAAALGLQGTPGFVIGRFLIPGAMSASDLRQAVHDARAQMAHGG